jgi:hypothetical protein
MTDSVPSSPDLGEELIRLGWRQGSVFRAPSLAVWRTQRAGTTDPVVRLVQRRFGEPLETDKYVVVTQTCDIVRHPAIEPNIEVLLCRIEPDRGRRGTFGKSRRYFEVDRGTGLVAAAFDRIILDKALLSSLTPEPWPDTEERLDRFAEWLGLRFSSPAIPDAIVNGFQVPAAKVLDEFRKRQPPVFRAFNEAVAQVRIGYGTQEERPFALSVLLLSFLDESTELQTQSIEEIMGEMFIRADSRLVQLSDYLFRRANRLSVKEYLSTKLLYFDYLTFQGNEVIGSPPYGDQS